MSTIGVIVGSTRSSRLGERIAAWVVDEGSRLHPDEHFQLIDLRHHPLPMFDTSVPPMAAERTYAHASVQEFSDLIDACDGFVFVTPEYNHSIPAVLKNAIDHLGPEWTGKPTGFVGYGYTRAIRAVSHLRDIMLNFSTQQDRNQVGIDLSTSLREGTLEFSPVHGAELGRVLEFVSSRAAQ